MKRPSKTEIAALIEQGDWVKVTGSRKNVKEMEFYDLICDILSYSEVQELKDYRHHVMTTRYQHCLNVSYYNYRLCRFLHLDADSAARAGMLHDLYHYDTKRFSQRKPQLRHNQYHPMLALEAAEQLVPLNERERDMIEKHMWPMTRRRPKYAETYVITFVDKYCALIEYVLPQPRRFAAWVRHRKNIHTIRKQNKADADV